MANNALTAATSSGVMGNTPILSDVKNRLRIASNESNKRKESKGNNEVELKQQ